jgi:hypothetical protein
MVFDCDFFFYSLISISFHCEDFLWGNSSYQRINRIIEQTYKVSSWSFSLKLWFKCLKQLILSLILIFHF